jgi:hypothetical protein
MKLEVVQFVSTNNPGDLISFWSQQYQYVLEYLYNDNIGHPLTEKRVWDLYKWKNGTTKISTKKQQSIRTVYLPELGKLPKLSTLKDGQTYINSLSGGAIRDIFWLHCVNPHLFPIFDQHTYRSMARIEGIMPGEIPTYRPKTFSAYFDKYMPFTSKFKSVSARELDRTLFSYGRFLKKGLSGK